MQQVSAAGALRAATSTEGGTSGQPGNRRLLLWGCGAMAAAAFAYSAFCFFSAPPARLRASASSASTPASSPVTRVHSSSASSEQDCASSSPATTLSGDNSAVSQTLSAAADLANTSPRSRVTDTTGGKEPASPANNAHEEQHATQHLETVNDQAGQDRQIQPAEQQQQFAASASNTGSTSILGSDSSASSSSSTSLASSSAPNASVSAVPFLEFGVASAQGRRSEMEDAHTISDPLVAG
jgi:hypothetical protein